jgi:hypothetical protein
MERNMFNLERKATNRLDIEIAGKIDREEMNASLDALIEQAADIENGCMLYRLGDFELPTAGAIAVELQRLPKLLGAIRRFERIAVIADEKWVRKAGEFEGSLLPGVEIRAFRPGEISKAESWLSGTGAS